MQNSMHVMSTNFAKTLVWKHENDVKLWRHKERTPNTNDHHMTLNGPPPWRFSAYATALQYICAVGLDILKFEQTKLANMLYQAHTKCLKQACFWKLVKIQLLIKILSEGFMMINFISTSSEFIQLLICEKMAGVLFV